MTFVLKDEQQAILRDLVDGGTGDGLYPDTDPDTFRPKANAYNSLFNLLGGDAGPVDGAEPAVWNWLRGS